MPCQHKDVFSLKNTHKKKLLSKELENRIYLTCKYNLSPFNLLSNFSNLFACSGTSSFIFIMHLVSRTTSKILGSKLTSNFPVSGCRTKSVACKATNKQLLALLIPDFCFQSCWYLSSPDYWLLKSIIIVLDTPGAKTQYLTQYLTQCSKLW